MLKIVWSLLAIIGLWLGGFLWFVQQVPMEPNHDETPADAIVALTGDSGRLEHALELLAEGKGRALFISGTSQSFTRADLLRMAPLHVRDAIATLPITLGHQAENTIGNAEETAGWLKGKSYRSIRLVTSNYHMPRSVSEFRQALPGVIIIPEPVFTDEFSVSSWWQDKDARALMLSEYHKYLASRLRHWLVSTTRARS